MTNIIISCWLFCFKLEGIKTIEKIGGLKCIEG
jgi:hypothetical protein